MIITILFCVFLGQLNPTMADCFSSPVIEFDFGCEFWDFDNDTDVDLEDYSILIEGQRPDCLYIYGEECDMAIIEVDTVQEIKDAFNGGGVNPEAGDGDTIRFIGAGSVAHIIDADLSNNNNITVDVSGPTDVTLTMGTNQIIINAQGLRNGITGTTQTWTGPIVVTSTLGNDIFDMDATLGDLTVNFTDVDAVGLGSVNGFRLDSSSIFDAVINCTTCESNNHSNDGFTTTNTGTGTCTMSLTNCSATGNTQEGVSPHSLSTINVIGGTYNSNNTAGDSSTYQMATGGNGATLNVSGGAIITGADNGAVSSGEDASVTIDGCTLDVTAAGVGDCLNVGGGSIIICTAVTFTNAGTGEIITGSATGGSATFDSDCTITHSGSGRCIAPAGSATGHTYTFNGCPIINSGSGDVIDPIGDNTYNFNNCNISQTGANGRAINGSAGTINITGGTITHTDDPYMIGQNSGGTGILNMTSVTVTLTDPGGDMFAGGSFALTATDCSFIVDGGRRLWNGIAATQDAIFINCIFSTNRNVEWWRFDQTSGTVTLWDCDLDINVSMTNDPIVQTTGALVMRRCKINASTWSNSDIENLFNLTAGTFDIEGCEFVSMDPTGGTFRVVSISGTADGSFVHNTLYRVGSGGTVNGLQVAAGISPTVRGNIFEGFDTAMEYAEATYTGTYNLTSNCTTDLAGGSAADATDLFNSPGLIFRTAQTDLRLATASSGRFLDPTPSYQIDQFALTLQTTGSGSVSRLPTDDITANSIEPVPAGRAGITLGAWNDPESPVVITASPSINWIFNGWSGDFTNSNTTATVTMDSAKTVTANFTQEITISTSNTGNPFFDRGTTITIDAFLDTATRTQWDFRDTNDLDTPLLLTTNSSGVTGEGGGSVLEADLKSINIWLPPFSSWRLRARQFVNGVYQAWTAWISFDAQGIQNSFDRFAQLNANTITIPE